MSTGPGYFWKQDDTGAGFAVENFLVIYCEMMDTILGEGGLDIILDGLEQI